MTKKEIARNIEKETKRIKTLENKIEDIRFDISATKKAIRFWRNELKRAVK